MIWLSVALTSLGLLIMIGAASCMTEVGQPWPARFFYTGAGILCLALIFWLVVAVLAFFGTTSLYGA